ncbi:MAG TPA: hypothetical protein VN924_08635 [Bryobacteraceae bacterium]|nr:hypothetical protein [Bryobacteraceae bacterium]
MTARIRRSGRGNWPNPAAELLADDPTLLASGGRDSDFKVLYARLAEDRLSLSDERVVASRLLKNHPSRPLRLLGQHPDELALQPDLASISPNLFGLSPLAITGTPRPSLRRRARHRGVLQGVPRHLRHREEGHQRLWERRAQTPFTQRLFNRMMFIAFIQKKGWLQFGGKNNQDYLNALWADYGKNGDKEMGFYYERLYNLFFHGLGAQDDVGIIKINRGGMFRDVIGVGPYPNGGLFEEDADDKDGGIRVNRSGRSRWIPTTATNFWTSTKPKRSCVSYVATTR